MTPKANRAANFVINDAGYYFAADVSNGRQTGPVGANTLTAAVPEPSTWAMMILGFAGVGFMAYRRSRSQHFGSPDQPTSELRSRLRAAFIAIVATVALALIVSVQ